MGKIANKLNVSVLSTKIARRVFLLFVMCSFLPLVALGYLAYQEVSQELSDQAEEALQRECKSASKTLFDRLELLEADLVAIRANLLARKGASLHDVTQPLDKHLRQRFQGLTLRGPSGPQSIGRLHPRREFTQEEREHLKSGALLATRRTDHGAVDVSLILPIKPDDLSSGMLFGVVSREFLWERDGFLSPSDQFIAYRKDGPVLFTTLSDAATNGVKANVTGTGKHKGTIEWSSSEDTWVASFRSLFLKPRFHDEWIVAASRPQSVIQAPVQAFEVTFLRVALITFLLALLLSFRQIHRRLIPVYLLHKATRRIAEKDYGFRLQFETRDEFEELGESFNQMAESMEKHLRSMATVNCIGVALTSEKNLQKLAETILTGAKTLTGADGGALYLVNDNQLELWMMDIGKVSVADGYGPKACVSLKLPGGRPNWSNIAACAVHEGKTVNIADVSTDFRFQSVGSDAFEEKSNDSPYSILTVPMRDHDDEIIGVLQLVNARNHDSQELISFGPDEERLTESLASQAAVAVTNNQLLQNYKSLFDSLAELIARAIDDKSPYTGEHCRRVPILTMMLADAVNKTRDGRMADFNMSDEELYELHVASLLHDCGKVVTPVHVVDKATKLETIFDRIDLVHAKFEIARRDLELGLLLEAKHAKSSEDAKQIREKYKCGVAELQADEAFVIRCNSGSEFMPEADRERIRGIALKYRWTDSEGEEHPLLTDDEVENLTIPKGTLTRDEREIINHHVVATINMLEALPYPKALQNVPHIAGTHHERMDGGGYPRQLTRDEILPQGRILGVADVFEALTSSDRPYKKPKKLSEALTILGHMCEEGHIDPDVFEVFIREKVYLRYAKEHLAPEQCDQVIESKIPGLKKKEKRSPLRPRIKNGRPVIQEV